MIFLGFKGNFGFFGMLGFIGFFGFKGNIGDMGFLGECLKFFRYLVLLMEDGLLFLLLVKRLILIELNWDNI